MICRTPFYANHHTYAIASPSINYAPPTADNIQLVRKLYQATEDRLKLTDIDQEIKEHTISCVLVTERTLF